MIMKSGSSEKEEARKNDCLADSEIVAETLPAAARIHQVFVKQQERQNQLYNDSIEAPFSHHIPIQPCQYTFLTAVKQKYALGSSTTTRKIPGKMEFIKPLKVPDMKITAKTGDFSSRESLLSNEEAAKRFEATQREDKALKCTDRVQRKLDFSSSSSSLMHNCENVEPLKMPDFSISSSQSKKKDHSRDSSREKENRSKKMKKDDWNQSKNKKEFYDPRRSKNPKHFSRKEVADVIDKALKNDRILAHGPRDGESTKKSKTKVFVNSSTKKDEDKKYKNTGLPLKAKREKSVESKGRTSSSESLHLSEKTKLHDRILIREGYKAMMSDMNDRKFKDDGQLLNALKQEDLKHKSHSESRSFKGRLSSHSLSKQSESKRTSDKLKSIESKHGTYSDISDDFESVSNTFGSSFRQQNSSADQLSQHSKSKDLEKSHSKSNRNSEESKYIETALTNSATGSTNIETKLSSDGSMSERLLDPRRISFRDDSYTQQSEFCDLITPDFNLKLRSKRRKHVMTGSDSESIKGEEESIPSSIHPATMHFKEESNLLDSYNESPKHSVEEKYLRRDENDMPGKIELEAKNDDIKTKVQKPSMKVAEVQTQTANDMATQTDCQSEEFNEMPSITYRRGLPAMLDIPEMSAESEDKYDETSRIEMSAHGKVRTMSEISLHETTSSIKTETGTEISISTRDVTCSVNKYLDLEMAQLIRDEKQRYDKIQMLFKTREKALNDRTKKLVKLEEQKRTLRDTGQDSRISSVKKKQRALLLKLQLEKDEMNRLKELHKIASQERKLMLRKQRDMFNPEMSTKNILTKLKRSADSQSPRRLSGPMKGYDIRSNSSISSLIESDKSQMERSHFDLKYQISDISSLQNEDKLSKSDPGKSEIHHDISEKLSKSADFKQKEISKFKYELKSRKYEEKMPKAEQLRLKSHQCDTDSKMKHGTDVSLSKSDESKLSDQDDKSDYDNLKSDSETLIEELSRKSKSSQPVEGQTSSAKIYDEDSAKTEGSKRSEKLASLDKESIDKLQMILKARNNSKRKGFKSQKSKPSNLLAENVAKLDDGMQPWEDVLRHRNKRSKFDDQSEENYQNSILEELDLNESQSSLQALLRHSKSVKERNCQLLRDIELEARDVSTANESEKSVGDIERFLQQEEDLQNMGNVSTRSQVSTLTISHHSSGDSEKSYSRSVVIRSQDHRFKTSKKLDQILHAREAALVSRRNCVEEWIAWHTRLRDEENRVARMEQAALKLVSATSKVLSCNDTTISSDTSDVEGRIEQLTQKLADRRIEMTRLKREARRQAKQRLRALEANLLNQIKKYDATINDMRKKLDSKKETIIKEGDKLAIESKSVADFKVPEIPIKKIQEIYKSSDILRSRSESDLLSVRSQEQDERWSSHTAAIKSADLSKMNSRDSSEKSDYSGGQSNKTKSNSTELWTQKSILVELPEGKRPSSQSSNISEDIQSDIHAVKSPTEISIVSRQSTVESPSAESNASQIFSKKLDHIQLNNNELNKDINTLEKDLKDLSEIMTHFSKNKDLNSSRDVSEELPELEATKALSEDLTDETSNMDFEARSKQILNEVEKSIMLASEKRPCPIVDEEPVSLKVDKNVLVDTSILVDEIIPSDITVTIDTKMVDASEVLSASEIVSAMESGKDESEVHTEEDKKTSVQHSVDKSVDYTPDDLIETEVDSVEKPVDYRVSSNRLHEDKSENEASDVSMEASENLSENATSKQYVETENISIDKISIDKDWSISESFEIQNVAEEVFKTSPVQQSIFSNDNINEDQNMLSYMEDSASFLPKGESTSIDPLGVKFDDSMFEASNKTHNIHSDDFKDILDIIDRDIKMDEEKEANELAKRTIEVDREEKSESIKEDVETGTEAKDEFESESTSDEKRTKDDEISESEVGVRIEAIEEEHTEESNRSKSSKEIEDPLSSEGEQLDNLIEVAEGTLATVERTTSEEEENIAEANGDAKFVTHFETLKDPEYEDISEESLEVSEILDRTESQKQLSYEVRPISDEVLRILDELSGNRKVETKTYVQAVRVDAQVHDSLSPKDVAAQSDVRSDESFEIEEINFQGEHRERSESSEGVDTPRGVSEIEMDSPRDPNDSRLDIEAMDDDLLSNNTVLKKTANQKEFHPTPMATSSEKDIEDMINKLKASLELPGQEVAEVEAKLLRIEQLQIELEIKRLEAEEVSFYVREIPNKPPPPYTPPSPSALPTSKSSPSPPPAVIPTNVDELTAFTEKATVLIFRAKESGEDILRLEAPTEICELKKDKETLKEDRRIYNTFLFDLCKELVSDVYQAEYEKPGPSWTKPNVKTKPAIKMPKSVDELNDYVGKEVATLFGFKTKLQRENMVMRWSRKRRDRVDELLAREAQAEEDEWTKFHQDELAVKNELTVTILDTLILETTNVAKLVYAKKRKVKV